MSDVHEVVNKAADLIEQHGWVQGKNGNKTCGFCIVGALSYALSYATSDEDEDLGRYREAMDLVGSSLPARADDDWLPGRVLDYNDLEGRTKDEVVGLLRKVGKNA